jgi:hypothetical protein
VVGITGIIRTMRGGRPVFPLRSLRQRLRQRQTKRMLEMIFSLFGS